MVSIVGPSVTVGRLQTRILAVITRPEVRQPLTVSLTEAGFTVAVATDRALLAQRVAHVSPHVALVAPNSLTCPLIGVVRDTTSVPILALVPADAPTLAAGALEQGADDCIAMRESVTEDPAFMIELLWRLNALLRRSTDLQEPFVGLIGPSEICLRPHVRDVTVGGTPVYLTPHEFDVLRTLLERRGEVVTADELVEAIWSPPYPESRGWTQSQVSRVRAKLRDAGADHVITTIRGFGYVIR